MDEEREPFSPGDVPPARGEVSQLLWAFCRLSGILRVAVDDNAALRAEVGRLSTEVDDLRAAVEELMKAMSDADAG